MFKMIGLLKRRPGMSVAEFREYYESKHRVIGEKYLSGYASRYLRRFMDPVAAPSATASAESSTTDYDVLLEIWYPDRATYEEASKRLQEPDIAAEIAADEEQLFDRPNNRFYLLDEHESDMS